MNHLGDRFKKRRDQEHQEASNCDGSDVDHICWGTSHRHPDHLYALCIHRSQQCAHCREGFWHRRRFQRCQDSHDAVPQVIMGYDI